jgi:hypothetical protein
VERDQFEELLLGLELTGMPFLAALKPSAGYEPIKLPLPEGRVKKKKKKKHSSPAHHGARWSEAVSN